MTAPRRLGRKPGPAPTLSRDDVARAALAEGVLTASMPAVARRLGVSHSTLYRYVHDRDDLALAALDLAVREFEWPNADRPWRALLEAFADALWRFLETHPGMAETIQQAPGLPPRVTELASTYGNRLREEGLSARDAVLAVDFVADLTVATEIAMRGLARTFDTPRGKRSLRELYAESFAALAGADVLDESALQGRGWLTEKVAVLLDGLAARIGGPVAAPEPLPAADREPGRAAIVAQGRELAREHGLGAVTVHAVADRLRARLHAVYREIGDRDGLIVAMLDAVAEDIVVPAPVSEPRDEVVALALAVHEALRADPWAVPALAVDGLAGPLILPVLERVFEALRKAGVPDSAIAAASRTIWDHVFGSALATAQPETFAMRLMHSAESPAISRVVQATEPRPDRPREDLTLLVDALLRRHGVS
ncbi:TetR family transcriptional regulator [Amycolatopsis sp. NPDC089917]|uniref:TetR family transcriptional regulator n=1 Tax=Amycolatopsis sp. NPDC089917 TaxID=3155187 RepID=UPI00343CB827